MRPRSTPTRLEVHRLKYHQNGRRGPLLKYIELDTVEKGLIQTELLQDVRIKRIDFTGELDEQIYDSVYMEVLSDWGVACSHPVVAIEKGKYAPYCRACKCNVIVPQTQKRIAK
jgi:hypothetical protein